MGTPESAAVGVLPAAGMSAEAVAELRAQLRGALLQAGDEAYDAARQVWNGMIDRRPALIARCAGLSDVIRTVEFARDADMPLAVRGGGHNIAGNAVADGAIVVDLSDMRAVHVDPEQQTARAEPGATWAELDRETQVFGLATTGGVISTTGIAGLTLGGGVGWLVRKHGMACDNLLSLDVVTPDGRFHVASAERDADLFWALRGGGSNVGIVTSMEYRLHPVGLVTGGMILHPLEDAPSVYAFFRDFITAAPDDLTLYCAIISTPDGTPVVALIGCYSGPPERAEDVLGPVRRFGTPIADLMEQRPYCEMQALLDPAFPAGMRYRWKSGFLDGLPSEAIQEIVHAGTTRSSPLSAVLLEYYGGAAARVPVDATAFPHRAAQFHLILAAQWADAADDDVHVASVRSSWDRCARFASGGAYSNIVDQGEDRVAEAFGSNHDRLRELKTRYDPGNLLRFNTNVTPARAA